MLGSKTYTILRNLCLPQKRKELKRTETAVETHYSPKPPETIQRFKLNTRQRKTEGTIAIYMSELRKFAENCNFGNVVNDVLRDCLVCGVNDVKIRSATDGRSTHVRHNLQDSLLQKRAIRDVCVFQGFRGHTSQVQKTATKKPTSQNEDKRHA